MKKCTLKQFLLLVLAGLYLSSAYAFVPSTALGAFTPGESHAALTKSAVQLVYDDLGVTKVTKSMKQARQTLLDANASVDENFAANTDRHCDAENLNGCNSIIVDVELSNAVNQLKADNVEAARQALGRALHTLQDFYSHSNWVELGNTTIHPEIGKPGCASSEGWRVQQETDLPGQKSEAP